MAVGVVVWGTRWFGKVDAVPGLFCVATKFAHVQLLPLIPLSSAIVFENSAHRMPDGQTGILAVNIPFNWKSYFTALCRSALLICLLVTGFYTFINMMHALHRLPPEKFFGHELAIEGAVAIPVICLLLYLSHRFSVASRQRAVELGRLAGFSEQLVFEQLAFDGYPLRKPARAFGLRNCPVCGALNRGVSGHDGNMICDRCDAAIPPIRSSGWRQFSVFENRRRADPGKRRVDIRYNLEITLQDAYAGKLVKICVPRQVTCDVCLGAATQTGQACPACSGKGKVAREQTLSVQIPPGIADGTNIRLKGEGEPGTESRPTGDLYIFVSIRPHEEFQRDGADLFCIVPVASSVAAQGGEIEAPCIDGGCARIKLPPGTQSGQQFRLKGKGMPKLGTPEMGDLYVQVGMIT